MARMHSQSSLMGMVECALQNVNTQKSDIDNIEYEFKYITVNLNELGDDRLKNVDQVTMALFICIPK